MKAAKSFGFVAALMVSLACVSPAWATAYDDAAAGDWNNAATWGGGSFPSLAADTAVIDQFAVIVPSGYVIPDITSIDVLTGGTLTIRESTVPQTETITLGGGTLNNNDPSGALYGANVTLGGTLEVEANSNLYADDYWVTGFIITGPVVSTTSNVKLTTRAWWQNEMWGVPDYVLRLDAASPGYTGSWDVERGWLKANANGAMGSGTVTIATGANKAGVNYGVSQTGVAGPSVVVNVNGWLFVENGVTVDFTNDPVTVLNGGTIWSGYNGGTNTLSDPIRVDANSTILQGGYGVTVMAGNITGGAGVTLTITGANNPFYLNGDNSGFLGHIEVTSTGPPSNYENWMRVHAANGDFGGAADVTIKNNGMVAFTEDYTSSLPPVTAEAGGRIQLKFSRAAGATPFTGDLTLDGGILTNQGYGDYYDSEMAGTLTLASDSTVQVSGENNANLYITGNVTGAKLIQTSGKSTLFMGGTSTGWTGGAEIRSGTMEVTSTTALGSGTVVVNGSGTLRTSINGAFGSAPAVVAESGGVIKINSTEGSSTKMILNSLGGLWVETGTTPMIYTGTTANIVVHAGAIFHESIATGSLPAVADIIDDGDGQYVWKGAGDFQAVRNYTVGLGGGGSVKGLAAMSTNATMNSNVTVTEFNAGSGFSLFTPGGSFRLQGPTFNGTGSVTLEGAGNYLLHANAFTGTITTLDYVGSGYVAPATDETVVGALGAGQTLNVHSGSAYWLWGSPQALGTGDTPDTFGTVNIKSGAMLYSGWERLNLTRGNIHIEAGGAMHVTSDWPAGAILSFDPGSQIVMFLPDAPDRKFTTQLPADGNASIVISQETVQLGEFGVQDIALNNSSRLLGVGWYNRVGAASGDIVLAPGATQARVAHYSTASDQHLTLENKVNIPVGTLVVGATGTFTAASGLNQWTGYTQNGQVWLSNPANVIEKIDIQGGQLRFDDDNAAMLGGADVHLNAGTTIVRWNDSAPQTTYPEMTFSGRGTINSRYDYQSVQLAGTTIDPGEAGTAGDLYFASIGWAAVKGVNFATGGGHNAQLVMDIVKDGGTVDPPVAGADYDVIRIDEDMAGMPNADFTVRIPLPSKNFKPANLTGDTLTVFAIPMDLSALVTGGTGWATTKLDTIDDAKDHWVGIINYINGGMTVTDLEWRGFTGDANLDDTVDVSDLSLLAGSFRQSGKTWKQGDFNMDGTVDVSDLSLLAGHYRQTNPNPPPGTGGAPVPEPVTMVLLGLGAVGLLARRRR